MKKFALEGRALPDADEAEAFAAGIVWALIPAGDANMELTPGRLLAYDASNFGVFGDGSKQLVVLWDSWK